MNLKNQVCTLEQSKILYKLGLRLTTIWYWDLDHDKPVLNFRRDNAISAYNVAELGVILNEYEIHKFYVEGQYNLFHKGEMLPFLAFGKNEAEARTNALIWLIREDYIFVNDLNSKELL